MPTVVPMAKDATMRRPCTQRKLVGLSLPTDQERGSSQIAIANLGQMIHVQTPTAIRNADHVRESTMVAEYARRSPALPFAVLLPRCAVVSWGAGPAGPY